MSGYRFEHYNPGKHCKECKDRYPGCHDNCDKYKAAISESNEYKAKVDEARQKERLYMGFKVERIAETKKAMNRLKHRMPKER